MATVSTNHNRRSGGATVGGDTKRLMHPRRSRGQSGSYGNGHMTSSSTRRDSEFGPDCLKTMDRKMKIIFDFLSYVADFVKFLLATYVTLIFAGNDWRTVKLPYFGANNVSTPNDSRFGANDGSSPALTWATTDDEDRDGMFIGLVLLCAILAFLLVISVLGIFMHNRDKARRIARLLAQSSKDKVLSRDDIPESMKSLDMVARLKSKQSFGVDELDKLSTDSEGKKTPKKGQKSRRPMKKLKDTGKLGVKSAESLYPSTSASKSKVSSLPDKTVSKLWQSRKQFDRRTRYSTM